MPFHPIAAIYALMQVTLFAATLYGVHVLARLTVLL
jgi:hypothetical protein